MCLLPSPRRLCDNSVLPRAANPRECRILRKASGGSCTFGQKSIHGAVVPNDLSPPPTLRGPRGLGRSVSSMSVVHAQTRPVEISCSSLCRTASECSTYLFACKCFQVSHAPPEADPCVRNIPLPCIRNCGGSLGEEVRECGTAVASGAWSHALTERMVSFSRGATRGGWTVLLSYVLLWSSMQTFVPSGGCVCRMVCSGCVRKSPWVASRIFSSRWGRWFKK